MMDITLSILALIAGGVTLELFTAPRSPVSHHEDKGVRLDAAAEEMAADFSAGNPS